MTWKLLGTRAGKKPKKGSVLGYARPGDGETPETPPKIPSLASKSEGPATKSESKERRRPKDAIGKQLQNMSLGQVIGVARVLAAQCEEHRLHTRGRIKRVHDAIERAAAKPVEQHGVAKMALAHVVRACCRRLGIEALEIEQEPTGNGKTN